MTLRTRITLLVGLVLSLALIILTVYSRQVAIAQFERMEDVEITQQAQPPDREAVAEAVARFEQDTHPEIAAAVQNQIGDQWQVLHFDSQGEVIGYQPNPDQWNQFRLQSDGTIVLTGGSPQMRQEMALNVPLLQLPKSTLAVFQWPEDGVDDVTRADVFSTYLNRWMLLGLLAVVVLALIAVQVLVRRVMQPVSELTASSRKLAAGDLDQRVLVRTKDELGDLARSFNQMSAELAQAEAARKALIDNTAHELRTPLTNMRCQLEAILDGVVPNNQKVVASLHEECLILSKLVDDLRDYSLATAGKLKLNPIAVNLQPAAQQAVAACGHASPVQNQPSISIDVPEQTWVHADAARLQQILRNLIANALRHTPSDGNVRITAAPIKDDLVELAVQDTGNGIAENEREIIFERFQQASINDADDGVGLGLAITKQLVELHGGSIWVQSAPGQGACFSIVLPAGDPETIYPNS